MQFSKHLPYYFCGKVVPGFGRGSKQLGCPTANVDDSVVDALPPELPAGVFFGLARVDNGEIYNMVMSIGLNPHYNNCKKTVEVHLLSKFDYDFYGSSIDCLILGFIREMTSFSSIDELKDAIHSDITHAKSAMKDIDQSKLLKKYFI